MLLRCCLSSAIQARDKTWYNALIAQLTADQQRELQDVLKIAEQRRAAQGA